MTITPNWSHPDIATTVENARRVVKGMVDNMGAGADAYLEQTTMAWRARLRELGVDITDPDAAYMFILAAIIAASVAFDGVMQGAFPPEANTIAQHIGVQIVAHMLPGVPSEVGRA